MSNNKKFDRERKIAMDKKHKPKYEIKPEPELISEEVYKGFPLKLVYDDGLYKVKSTFFKDGISAIGRKTANAALNQGYYLVHLLYNYADERALYISSDGIHFLKHTEFHSCQYFKDECICKPDED